MGKEKWLFWCDLETAGTDERLDPILEAAVILTDMNLDIFHRDSFVIDPGYVDDAWISALHPAVQEMHKANGLFDDIAAGKGVSARTFERDTVKLLSMRGQKHEFMIAGSGVGHFDRRFIRAQMAELDSWLSYPAFDVGTLRRFHQWFRPKDVPALNEAKTHRAMDDIDLHLQECMHYREALRT